MLLGISHKLAAVSLEGKTQHINSISSFSFQIGIKIQFSICFKDIIELIAL